MKKKKVLKIVIMIVAALAVIAIWFMNGGGASLMTQFMPPIEATIKQDKNAYGEQEKQILVASQQFWSAMEQADEAGMRAVADPRCTFVHIGMTCKLDEEIGFYTSGTFVPTSLDIHDQSIELYGDTAIVITDCDYALSLGGSATSHHFAVTEVYVNQNDEWKLVQFSFTALIS